jgi:hypothetical protein
VVASLLLAANIRTPGAQAVCGATTRLKGVHTDAIFCSPAACRFRDNRHNVSDVVAGMLLGSFFAPLFLARLAWHSSGWEAVQQQEEEEGWQLQANPSAALPVLPAISSEINGQSNMRSVQLVNVHQ